MTGFLAGRCILVVEDEMLVLMNIERTIEEMGCSAIFAAATIAQALQLLNGRRFDAVLLDINLGGVKSYLVADVLVGLGIPFAFSTGYSDHGVRIDLNNRPLLRKPYVRASLIAVLEQLITSAPLPAAA